MTTALSDACLEAARRYGTPLYLYDLARLRADAAAVVAAFPDPWLRLYALKANGLPALLRDLPALGFGASAVSGGELSLAARAGFTAERTALEGIGKTEADLRRAVALASQGTPLLWVSLESADEAARLARLAGDARTGSAASTKGGARTRGSARTKGAGGKVDVLVRVNPGVQPETHRGLAVGRSESKFGVLAEELPDVIAAGGGTRGPLRWRGIHIHIGSQLGAVDAWRSALRLGLRLVSLQRGSLPDFDTLDAGSGFPVEYGDTDTVPAPLRFGEEATAELDEMPPDARPARLAIEPGRAVVAASGWLVARVLHVRDREHRTVVLDAGMTELIRPALYGAEHPMVALTSLGRPLGTDGAPPVHVRVEGPICESTDHLGEADLPPLRRDDIVAIGSAGAYASSMASTYNGRPRPPEIAWDDGGLEVLRMRGRIGGLP